MQPIKLIDFIASTDANLKGEKIDRHHDPRLPGGGYLTGLGGTQQAADSARYFKRYMEGTEKPDNPVQLRLRSRQGKKKESNR